MTDPTESTLETQKMGPSFYAMIHMAKKHNPQRHEKFINSLTFGYGTALLVRYENRHFKLFPC